MRQLPFLLIFSYLPLLAQKPTLYLMPGFGSDKRVLSNLDITAADTVHLHYLLPEVGESLSAYAQRMAQQIDTSGPVFILGVSFGGMIAVEMSKILHPKHIFLVASAKTQDELPLRYRFQRHVPVYKWLGGRYMIRRGATGAYLFEADMRNEMVFFKSMLSQKDPRFMERAFGAIANWDNQTLPMCPYTHLHGRRDHTLPARRIKGATLVDGGHWMVYFNATEVSKVVNERIAMSK
jgi:pimeloyl-ACP methyl ester carboxylesterase